MARPPDIIARHLDVLFCGINPGMGSAAAGHNFVGRSNRFWKIVHLAGFTPSQILPQEDHLLLDYGCGVTSVVDRPTAGAAELSRVEFQDAAQAFNEKIARYAPRIVAFLGKAGYVGMTGQRDIGWGKQPVGLHGADVWVLPNPSGRNRAFSLDRLVEAYRSLHLARHALDQKS
ncbi:G/U mismatch-specific DNA glycosylase [Luteibacter sp. RCC_6_2]|uniref:G/U mismatch-specific DNA glycosylase n=1 Tax=Luteibacter sp. RCC_6_2 TaxID=3239223 RepID=UPI0035256B85